MWNTIVNAAKAVYNTIAPKAAAPKAPTSSGGLTVKPIVTQPTLSVKPIAPTPTVVVKSPQQVAAQQQASLQVTPSATQSQIDFANQQKAVAAATNQQSTLAKIWAGALAPAAKIGDLYAAYKGKQYLAKQVENQNAGIPDMVNRWRNAADATVTKAKQDLANGKINVDQYNSIIDAENSKLQTNAKNYTDYFSSENKQLNQPLVPQIGTAIDAISKVGGGIFGNLWKYTLGEGNKNVPSLVTLPARAYNLARNAVPNDWGIFKSTPTATGNAWQKTFGQPVLPDANQDPAVYKQLTGKNPAWFKTAEGMGSDPINFLPAGWLSKIAKGGSWLPKIAAGAVAKTGFGQDVKLAKDFIAGSKPAQLVGSAFSKLAAPTRSVNSAWLDKVHAQLNGANTTKFEKTLTNQDEVNAYTDLMQGKTPTWGQNVDKAKVQAFAKSQRDLYNSMQDFEKGAGLGTKYKTGYMPTKTTPTDTAFSFLKSKADMPKSGWTVDSLKHAEALRQWEHLQALHQTGLLTDASKAAARLATPTEHGNVLVNASKDLKVLRNAPNRRFLSTDTSTIRKPLTVANHAWKAAVLKYNPAWYVHNTMWNTPASFMAGGAKTFGGYAKMFKRGSFAALPKELTAGAFGGLGGKIENLARGAAYHGSIAKGMTKDQAVANVNKYLFDYSKHSNWEKPIRNVLPFWSWQKNIAALTAKLPNSNPRWASAFSKVDQANRAALNQLPKQGVSYTDPETGQTVTTDPQKQFAGKIHTPFGWISAAGLPILPSQLSQFGLSPYLTSAKQFFTGKDYFGNSTGGQSLWRTLADNLPQTKLATSVSDMATKGGSVNNWISSSGYSKQAQGFDPTKPNYKAALDPSAKFISAIKSMSGIPFPTNFDMNKFRNDMRYQQFANEYFNTDFSKITDYNARQTAKEAVASKYGYDLNKDIYQGMWSKYDSKDTALLKTRAASARALENQVYDIYNKLPAGTGARSQFIAMWKATIGNGQDANPDFNVFKNVPISGEVPKAKGGFAAYKTTSGTTAKAKTGSSKFWADYYATNNKAIRAKMIADNPQYSKPTTGANAKFAWAYQNLPPDVRTNWLKKEGLTDPAKANWTTSQWADYLTKTGNDFNSKYGRDLAAYPNLGQSQLDIVNNIIGGFKPVAKIGSSVKFKGFTRAALAKRKR